MTGSADFGFVVVSLEAFLGLECWKRLLRRVGVGFSKLRQFALDLFA